MATGLSISAQLDILEEKHPPIPLPSVDFTVRNKELLRGRFFRTLLRYFGIVENEVERNIRELRLLLPHADENTQRFYGIWESQELPHGAIFDTLQSELGLQPGVPQLGTISRSLRIGGYLSRLPGIHDVLLHVYLTTGALHERLTAVGYKALQERLEACGEHAIAQTAIARIRPQESGHFAYYVRAAREVHLHPWQRVLSRRLRVHTYAPVGAGTVERKADFGQITEGLLGGNTLEDFAAPVQRVAQDLLVAQGQGLKLPLFVRDTLRECIDLHHQRLSLPM